MIDVKRFRPKFIGTEFEDGRIESVSYSGQFHEISKKLEEATERLCSAGVTLDHSSIGNLLNFGVTYGIPKVNLKSDAKSSCTKSSKRKLISMKGM